MYRYVSYVSQNVFQEDDGSNERISRVVVSSTQQNSELSNIVIEVAGSEQFAMRACVKSKQNQFWNFGSR